jgi:ligand-binding sensor domain-containing protein
MNNLLSALLFAVCVSSCNGQGQKTSGTKAVQSLRANIGDTVSDIGKNIGCILQDRNGHYWFASNGEGVYRYDGKTLTHITDKDGICSNFVLKIQEDVNGIVWFSTRDGVCSFNGNSFTNYTDMRTNTPNGNSLTNYSNMSKNTLRGKIHFIKGGLFFNQLNSMCFYDGTSFTHFSIHPDTYTPRPSSMYRPYSVYSTLIDKAGNVWFGTQEKGVCRYDGNSYTFFTEQGLDQAAVRTLFQDKAGNIWAGNNGAGLFKFNGKGFTNFTDEKGLANRDFLKKLGGKEGTLARPWTINEDDSGNLWIGTIDAGVWKYDGTNLTNYTTKDGLTGKAIWTIYKDKKGELWFVTDGEAICTFNGKTFTKHTFH